jgi:predicted NUDIX family NTP pyrophosphohydrolase
MARAATSAGIVLFRVRAGRLEILAGHMGGPLWARRDERAWSIPKGGYVAGEEEPWAAACREFAEETGHPVPDGRVIDLGEVRQGSGKRVRAWAVEGDLDPETVVSATFRMQWPPRSGRELQFPEIDRAAWLEPAEARRRLVAAQAGFVDALEQALRG